MKHIRFQDRAALAELETPDLPDLPEPTEDPETTDSPERYRITHIIEFPNDFQQAYEHYSLLGIDYDSQLLL